MSEDERDVDVESDDVPEVGVEATATCSASLALSFDGSDGLEGSLDKRAHHNALERRRRDHIKDSFHGLRDCIPSLIGEKVSRAHILNKATDYIRQMQKSGIIRENEITDLSKKSEILEEQVRALEQAKAMGAGDNAEELLQMVAEKVISRQRQQSTAPHPTVHSTKSVGMQSQAAAARLEKNSDYCREVEGGSKDHSSGGVLMSKRPLASSQDGKAAAVPVECGSLPSSFNLLANNLKNAQTLLTALQKNLPANTSLPASVKSLAARVLASPLRAVQQGTTSSAPTVPRGIVTATQVPKGTLPSTLASALQQPSPQQPPKSQQQLLSHATSLNSTAAMSSSGIAKQVSALVSQLMPGAQSEVGAGTVPPAHPAETAGLRTPSEVGSPANRAGSQASSTSPPILNLAPSSSSTSISSASSSSSLAFASTQLDSSLISQAASQLLEANSLLLGSTAEHADGISLACDDSTTSVSPDLLAQVSSFLNLPAVASKLAEGSQPAEPSGLFSSTALESHATSVAVKRGPVDTDLEGTDSAKRARLDL